MSVKSNESSSIRSKTQEVRALDLSVDGFTFRLAEHLEPEDYPSELSLSFYSYAEACHKHLVLRDFELQQELPDAEDLAEMSPEEIELLSYCTLYRVTTNNSEFHQLASSLMQEYLNYVQLKNAGNDSVMSQTMTGYSAIGETQFPECFSAQKSQLFSNLQPDDLWLQIWEAWLQKDAAPNLTLSLDTPALAESYLSNSVKTLWSKRCSDSFLEKHPLAQACPSSILVGNEFCPHLFPPTKILLKILEKSAEENLSCCLAFAPASEHEIEARETLFTCINEKISEAALSLPEFIVNDYGTLELVHRTFGAEANITLGVLMNKRKKDTRLEYLNEVNEFKKERQNPVQAAQKPLRDSLRNLLLQTPSNAAFLGKYMADHYGVKGYAYESCEYTYEMPDAKNSLIFPWYQMNTATACTLYAACTSGDRGAQKTVLSCPNYCQNTHFLYPEMLHMVGYGNTLFGCDLKILTDGNYLKHFMNQDIHRLILRLL